MQIEDQLIVDGVRTGDEGAIMKLAGYIRKLRMTQCQISRIGGSLEDIRQETLVDAYYYIRRGNDIGSLRAVVCTIFRRNAADYLQSQANLDQPPAKHEAWTSLAVSSEDIERRLCDSQLLDIALEEVQALGSFRRGTEIITRIYFEGQGCQEAIKEMRLTPTQFRLNKWRSLEALRRRFRERTKLEVRPHQTRPRIRPHN